MARRTRSIDRAIVRDRVREAYAEAGRSSIDPGVFFKSPLVRFVEGRSSKRHRTVFDEIVAPCLAT